MAEQGGKWVVPEILELGVFASPVRRRHLSQEDQNRLQAYGITRKEVPL